MALINQPAAPGARALRRRLMVQLTSVEHRATDGCDNTIQCNRRCVSNCKAYPVAPPAPAFAAYAMNFRTASNIGWGWIKRGGWHFLLLGCCNNNSWVPFHSRQTQTRTAARLDYWLAVSSVPSPPSFSVVLSPPIASEYFPLLFLLHQVLAVREWRFAWTTSHKGRIQQENRRNGVPYSPEIG